MSAELITEIRQGLINAYRAGGIWLVEASSLRNYIANAPKPGRKPEAKAWGIASSASRTKVKVLCSEVQVSPSKVGVLCFGVKW